MAFSRAQQGEYRPLTEAAWRVHCRRNGADQTDKVAKDHWIRGHLETATGHRSSKDCDGGRDFERACAHFESLTEAGIAYQLRAFNGDLKRIRYAIQKVHPPFLRQFADDRDLSAWLRGIARQSLNLPQPPELHDLDDDAIRDVTKFACIAAARAARKFPEPAAHPRNRG